MSPLTKATKKKLAYLIKASVLLLAGYFIYSKLINDKELYQFEKLLTGIGRTRAAITMSIVFAMMLLNWVLEAAKWQYLTRRLMPMSLWKATEAVFCGLTWAFSTPNRLGEYGGRVMFLPPRKRIMGVFAMAVGSFGQNVVTNVVGALAIMWFVWYFLHIALPIYIGLYILANSFIILFLLFYFNLQWMVSLFDKVKLFKKYHRFFGIMAKYTFGELIRIMGFCVARYTVFSLQYYVVLHMLVPGISLHDTTCMISIMMFIQSAIPSLDIFDIGVRTTVAAYLFSFITAQTIAVVATVASIWFINLVIPAILGSVFIFKLKFFDNNI